MAYIVLHDVARDQITEQASVVSILTSGCS